MAGISDPPFRRLCRRGGAALVCAEMVSSNALHFNDAKSRRMLTVFPDEHPVSMQVFGAEPDRLAEAARKAQDAGADIVDLNCGCPVPKITQTGAGIRLMEDEALFGRCLEAMARAVTVPVTVKMRLGVLPGENRASRLARVAESAGAAAVSVHARFRGARHSGPADLAALKEAVEAVRIPVFGNGGVATYADARRMIKETGCAAVMIGQAAVGNPLIFQEFLEAWEAEQGKAAGGKDPSADEPRHVRRFRLLREHARMNAEYFGEERGLVRLRKCLPAYAKDLPHAAEFRAKAYTLSTLAALFSLVEEYETWLEKASPKAA